jgi:hypothetical protein
MVISKYFEELAETCKAIRDKNCKPYRKEIELL